MPRKGRIQIVGKFEALEIEVRGYELKELEITLHREWRERDVPPPPAEDDEQPDLD